MSKAISTVVASVLMLMIVVALGGTTYLFISGTFTSRTATTFEIIDSLDDSIIIRNSGTEPITKITATLNGNSENIAVVPSIQGLVGYWSFNEESGSTTADNSGNKNVGTLNTGGSGSNDDPSDMWTSGRFGNALEFDGNDRVHYGDLFDNVFNGDFSVSFWFVEPSEPSTWINYIIFKGTGTPYFAVGITGPPDTSNIGKMQIKHNDDKVLGYSSKTYHDNKWHHVVVTRGDSVNEVKLYTDGTLDNTFGDLTFSDSNEFLIGISGNLDRGFSGMIDEVAIYNRVLSESEIKQLYSGLVSPGQLAIVKPITPLSKGTHNLRLCTSSMCNAGILTII